MRGSTLALSMVLCSVTASAARAQIPTDEVPPPPPAAPAQEAPAGDAPPALAPPPVEPATCAPPCREGYLCHEGSCISACNPPCASGEHCTASGECESGAGPAYDAPPFNPQPISDVEPPSLGNEEHDGFMLRLAIGLGAATLTETVSGGGLGDLESDFSGAGGTFSIDLGGAVTENLVLHGRLADFLIFDPSVTVDGMDVGEATDVSVGGVMFGIGATYYFMPINLYVTGVVGPGRIVLDDGDTTRGRSEYGFAMNLDLGKEWWVSAQWGLGVALRMWFNTVSEDSGSLEGTLDFTGGAILFSATYQ